MSKTSSKPYPKSAHGEIAELIPWYAKNQLSAAEQTKVKAHLDECELCRQELADCRGVAKSISSGQPSWQPSAAHFASILANVDKLEAGAQLAEIKQKTSAPGLLTLLGNWLKQTPAPVRWTLAAETLAFAVLAGMLFLPRELTLPGGTDGSFTTLSNPDNQTEISGANFHLVFAETATAKEISALLIQAKAQIRQGPNAVGAYTIEVPSGEAAAMEVMLKKNPNVKVVLPVKP